MIRVRIFTNFLDSTHFMKCCCKMWGLDDYSWPVNNPVLRFVDDDSYTHAIIINATKVQLKPNVTKDKVLGLAFEPLELLCPGDASFRQFVKRNILPDLIDQNFYHYAKQYIGEYFVGYSEKLPKDVFVPYYNFMYSNNWQDNRKRVKNKTKTMSLILSKKQFLPGHHYRLALVKLILATKLDIDIWGYGSTLFDDERCKGAFDSSEPYDDYLYTIAIENTFSEHYMSEKILNPIGCDCIPLYLGAQYGKTYLGQHSYHELTGDLISDFNKIITIATDPEAFLLSLTEAQNEVENGKACFPKFIAEKWL